MTLELVNELGDIRALVVKDRQPVQRVRPLRTTDVAPPIFLASSNGYWTAISQQGRDQPDSRPLVQQGPVVVGFYCPCWGRYAGPFLDALIQLAEPVRRAGGQLVVFTNEHPHALPPKARQAALTLVYDAGKSVAQQFGVYADTDPIWDRISGISEEVYVPALYVLDETGQIRYHFLDENFEGFTDQAALCKALFL